MQVGSTAFCAIFAFVVITHKYKTATSSYLFFHWKEKAQVGKQGALVLIHSPNLCVGLCSDENLGSVPERLLVSQEEIFKRQQICTRPLDKWHQLHVALQDLQTSSQKTTLVILLYYFLRYFFCNLSGLRYFSSNINDSLKCPDARW